MSIQAQRLNEREVLVSIGEKALRPEEIIAAAAAEFPEIADPQFLFDGAVDDQYLLILDQFPVTVAAE